MKLFIKIISGILLLIFAIVVAAWAYIEYGPGSGPNWHVEKNAVPSATHPLAGFYKDENCNDNFGWAIGPANEKEYYVSFCGPGGCFAEDTYRPNTTIYNDSNYEVINENTIKFQSKQGWSTHVRCPSRT